MAQTTAEPTHQIHPALAPDAEALAKALEAIGRETLPGELRDSLESLQALLQGHDLAAIHEEAAFLLAAAREPASALCMSLLPLAAQEASVALLAKVEADGHMEPYRQEGGFGIWG
jgi:hypothetical protein